ncbi:unnamed protein product [Arctia plantaginis]|uniref:Uncharacterized protein n=1 Tax=Arctia plantaginis TaxID=874455 RepID=A0A8S1B8Z6_ARCPL|nr:unnamed protein product [Arctia plantaginis]
MFMIVLSIFLFYGIYKENVAFLVPWVVGCMTFMALEVMAMVYSNILRDHVNKQFDSMCKAEISFLIPRILLNNKAPSAYLPYADGRSAMSMYMVRAPTIPSLPRRRHMERRGRYRAVTTAAPPILGAPGASALRVHAPLRRGGK